MTDSELKTAVIEWIPEFLGGRTKIHRLSEGERFIAPAFVVSSESVISKMEWSIAIYGKKNTFAKHIIEHIDGSRVQLVDVKFFYPNSPNDKLVEGVTFTMYEGGRPVLNGKILN